MSAPNTSSGGAVAQDSTLDWRTHHALTKPKPCRACRRPAFLTDETGTPCHKVCAERELLAPPQRRSA